MSYTVRCVGCHTLKKIPSGMIDHPLPCSHCGLTALPQLVQADPKGVLRQSRPKQSLVALLSAWAVGLAAVGLLGYEVASVFMDSTQPGRLARHAPKSAKQPGPDHPVLAAATPTTPSNAIEPGKPPSPDEPEPARPAANPDDLEPSGAKSKSTPRPSQRDGSSNDSKGEFRLKLSQSEQLILDLTNGTREKQKLPLLKPNPVLFSVARAHAANMAHKGVMNHVLDGKTPVQRVREAGYAYSWTGENVAYSSELDVRDTFKGWMESAGHRENILRRQYREIGIGVAIAANGEAYYAQVFGAPQ